MSSEQPKEPHLLYLDKSTPEEFQNAELMDWVYLVGDISTQYELDFVRKFGHAMKSRPHPAAEKIPMCGFFGDIDCCQVKEIRDACPVSEHCMKYYKHTEELLIQQAQYGESRARQTREKTIEEIWLHVQSFCDPMTEDYLKSLRSTRHIEQQPAILPNPEMGRFDP